MRQAFGKVGSRFDKVHTREARNELSRVGAIIGNTVTADTAIAAAEHNAATTGTQLGEQVADLCSIVDGNSLFVIAVTRSELDISCEREFHEENVEMNPLSAE